MPRRAAARAIASVGLAACFAAGALIFSFSCIDTTPRAVEDAEGGVDGLSDGEAGSSADGGPPVAQPRGPVAYPIPGSCSDNEFITIPFPTDAAPVTPCGFLGCCEDYVPPSGGEGGCFDFALCEDGSFSLCSCLIPIDGSLVESGVMDVDAKPDS
jgi:hypothetical protein